MGASVLKATSQVANSVSGLAIAAVWELSESAWRRVECIFDVVGNRCDGHVAVDGVFVRYWLDSILVQALAPCLRGPMQDRLQEAAAAVSKQVPLSHSEVQEVNTSGSYVYRAVLSMVSASGYILLGYTVVNITFDATWGQYSVE